MIACANCGANLKFNPKSQKLHCDFCDSEFDPKLYEEKPDAEEHAVNVESSKSETFEVTVFTCPQCGGELMSVDENTAAAFCSFCGASTILNSRIEKGKRPEYIIPFGISKEDCKEAYSKLAKKALFLPKELKSKDYIDGFRGIYMPYWLYDVENKGKVKLNGEKSKRSGDYIITNHYDLVGNVDAMYEGLSFDAASSFSDNISEALAPFDIKKREKFSPAFMSGYYADIADVKKEIYVKDAEKRAYDITLKRIKGCDTFRKYSIKDTDNVVGDGAGNAFPTKTKNAHSSMLPVWFMSYRNGDRVAYATVNGQTGKVAADLPIDIKKYLFYSGILSIIIFAILNIFLVLKPSTVLLFTNILMLIVFAINYYQRISITKRENGEDDKGSLAAGLNKKMKNNTKGDAGEKAIVSKEKIKSPEMMVTIIGFVLLAISAYTYLGDTVSDIPYYVLCVLEAVVFGACFRYTLSAYNRMVTRKLPQFDRKGGDDRA